MNRKQKEKKTVAQWKQQEDSGNKLGRIMT